MIQQWVEEISNPMGAQPTWQALPHATRTRPFSLSRNG